MNSRNCNSLYLCPTLVHNCLTLSLEYAQAHRSLACEASRKSFVMLKNGQNGDSLLLPFNRDAKKVLVVGCFNYFQVDLNCTYGRIFATFLS
jgi:hypothetical protein